VEGFFKPLGMWFSAVVIEARSADEQYIVDWFDHDSRDCVKVASELRKPQPVEEVEDMAGDLHDKESLQQLPKHEPSQADSSDRAVASMPNAASMNKSEVSQARPRGEVSQLKRPTPVTAQCGARGDGTCRLCAGKVKGCPHCPPTQSKQVARAPGSQSRTSKQALPPSNTTSGKLARRPTTHSISTTASSTDFVSSKPQQCTHCGAARVEPKKKKGVNLCKDRCQQCFRKF